MCLTVLQPRAIVNAFRHLRGQTEVTPKLLRTIMKLEQVVDDDDYDDNDDEEENDDGYDPDYLHPHVQSPAC